ncbi:endonuclease domain-containing protein [Coleofasciculus sp. F4-SAH-05]|uniref:endonuclease domain-containing protein n=1 Tax=Coleofasciculus sp. F4-SAH-05 TaxID=3069525 RepID=UPI003302F148
MSDFFSDKINPHPSPLPQGEGVKEGVGEEVKEEVKKGDHLAGINRHIPDILLQRARELRKKQTPAEKLLWQCLRNRQLLNAKFRRQHNIGRYIADFYCHEARLVVELDGSIHEIRKAEDAIRNEWMQKNGFTVLRFSNQEVFHHPENVLYQIVDVLTRSLY